MDGTKLHLVVRKVGSDEDEAQQENAPLWAEMEKTLAKHFTKDDAARVLEQFKKVLLALGP